MPAVASKIAGKGGAVFNEGGFKNCFSPFFLLNHIEVLPHVGGK